MSEIRRVLVVPDWNLDFDAVLDACRRRQAAGPVSFALLVPARLHGVDWVGDPYASVPCAERALEEMRAMFSAAGLPLHSAGRGDPDPVAAIVDAILDALGDEVLLCERRRALGGRPFDLASRARRAVSVPVTRLSLPVAAAERRPPAWRLLRDSHCEPAAPRPA
jgi:hypothetical protein